MTPLPQTQCPHCKAPVNVFAPGCFQCRNRIDWPPPGNDQHAALAEAARQVFQAELDALNAAPKAQPPSTVPITLVPPSRPAPTAAPQEGVEGLEATRHMHVAYDPSTAQDVEGLLPQSFREMMPAQVPVDTLAEYVPTKAPEGPGLGIQGLTPQDGFEPTRMELGDVVAAALPELDRASFAETTANAPVPVGAEPELVPTMLGTERRPAKRAAKGAGSALGSRVCPACAAFSDKANCPACGAPTRARGDE